MNKREYIDKVLSQIDGKAYLEEIKTELKNHIEDREEYYTKAGYDSDVAEQKAVAHMGDAEEIGEEMNMLYNYKKHKIISIAGLSILLFYLLCYSFLYYLFRGISIYSLLDTYPYSIYGILFILIMLCAIYRCTLYSRGRVVMFLQGIISFNLFYHTIFDLFALEIGVAAITFFVHGIICLTCTAEINSAIKGNPNNAIMKRYKVWEKIFYILTAICTLTAITEFNIL